MRPTLPSLRRHPGAPAPRSRRPWPLRALARGLAPQTLAVARVGIGGLLAARPDQLVAVLGTPEQDRGVAVALTRMLGVRDAALGLGTVVSGSRRRTWLLVGGVSDLGDAAALGLAARSGAVKPAPAAVGAGVAALAGLSQLLGALRR